MGEMATMAVEGSRDWIANGLLIVMGIIVLIVLVVAVIAFLLDSAESIAIGACFAVPVTLFAALAVWLGGTDDGLAGWLLVAVLVEIVIAAIFFFVGE